MNRLEGVDQAMTSAITTQAQLVADIKRAPDLAPDADALAKEMRAALTGAPSGSRHRWRRLIRYRRSSESASSRRSSLPCGPCPGSSGSHSTSPTRKSTGRPDRDVAEEVLATLSGLSADLPILANQVTVIEAALAEIGRRSGCRRLDRCGRRRQLQPPSIWRSARCARPRCSWSISIRPTPSHPGSGTCGQPRRPSPPTRALPSNRS